jgi:hypothetical protein
MVTVGARLLFLRRRAGIRVLGATGAVIAVQSISGSPQSSLTGADLAAGDPLWTLVYVVAPTATVLAAAAVATALHPFTRRWCLA